MNEEMIIDIDAIERQCLKQILEIIEDYYAHGGTGDPVKDAELRRQNRQEKPGGES